MGVGLTYCDYYTGGMIMPGRSSNFDAYRFGFNGMESDDEVSGEGNSYTTEYRQYDPRIMRWKSLDPLMSKYPGMSPYVAFNNNPLRFVDTDGREGEDWVKGGKFGENNWGWDPDVTTGQEALDAGYSDYSDGFSFNTYRTQVGGDGSQSGTVTLGSRGSSDWSFTPDTDKDEEIAISSFLWDKYTFSSDYASRAITNPTPGSDGYEVADKQGFRDAWGSKEGWEAVVLSAKVVSVGAVVAPTAFIAGPSASGSNFFGVSSNLSAKVILPKMGVSAVYQMTMNKGEVNGFATVVDGILAPGSGSLIGNLWNPSFNVTSGEVNNTYLGSGISVDEYIVKSSWGMVFGAKQSGLDAVSGSSAKLFNQFSSGMGSNGLSNTYEKE